MATDKNNEKTERTTASFEYEGKTYKLEYTAASLKKLEDRGFDVSMMEQRTIQYPEEIFCGAFIANHDDVPYEKRMEIFREISAVSDDGEDIINVFTLMVAEAIAEIRSHRGNVKWKVNK